jgi:hypothetical protein
MAPIAESSQKKEESASVSDSLSKKEEKNGNNRPKDSSLSSISQTSLQTQYLKKNKGKMLEVEEFYVEFSSQGNRREIMGKDIITLNKDILQMQTIKAVYSKKLIF